ncbi:TPA: fimbrial protein [Escherichia coli]|uniref:fimbrial protein n=1 Tax=Escherichia coli TaxID=562 RepID=UPI000D17900E|nr:fimbrial protein [Escherichia coli]EAC1420436.1 fimbrial protein [Escherichia coli]EEY6120477.1 fimbrial protein [Escherichia coli]EHJ0944960.1 fimbrial protein [Escherichia coli]EHM3004013.1 fimbrial protein [Escherichia coli]EKP4675663.1 fimbrial protein [Escherichia coli]
MQGKANKLLLHICSAMLLFLTSSWCVFAGTGSECYIESNSAGGYTMLINTPTYNVVTREVTNPQEMADATKDVPITLRGDGVACKAIPNGDETIHFLNTADAGLISGYTSGRGSTLLKTTVPGIVYTVELICDSCPEPIDLYLPTVGEDNFTPNSDTWWVWSQTDDKWKLRFRFFYTPEFKPKNGVSSGTLSPGKIAFWYIGINTQPWIHFYVDTNTFRFTVAQPTCTTIALDSTSQNVSGNKINLGDYYISQVKQEITRVVPFSIRADYCYASKITVKLKATTEAPNKKLIGKSSGSATGVGVKVYSTANKNEVQLNADNSNEIIFNYAHWSNNLIYFPFTAQLVKDGGNGTISPGDFTGNATFSFSYE